MRTAVKTKPTRRPSAPIPASHAFRAFSGAWQDPTRGLNGLLGNQTVQRLIASGAVRPKMSISQPNDPYEREADRVAERVMRMPAPGAEARERTCGACAAGQSTCPKCTAQKALVQRRVGSGADGAAASASDSLLHSLGAGRPLDPGTRAFFEPRFGHDFSQVRVHADTRAAESARSVNALAYTARRDIVFNDGQYAPSTGTGQRLLAHELAHVVQQEASVQPRLVQRDGMGDVHLAEGIHDLLDQIRATPAFTALDAASLKLTEEIIAEIRKRSRPDQYHFLSKLKLLFDTPVKPPATISTETHATTVAAAATEKVRVAKPAASKLKGIEEAASADPKRSWLAIPGKFGGGTYYVDRTSATNIVVKADVLLTPKGTGTADDVKSIKSMEDGIEKAASTKGYIVDIRFVDVAGPDTFRVDVDPSQWEVATNWSGGDPLGFAHELHHMFAFELDRYNYIEAHADNESMEIPNRLIWFREELKKPANYNDPTSIMDSAAHPNDDDACRVAGLDIATCVAARAVARAGGKL